MAEERIMIRRDTAANWTSNNPTLGNGEPGYETDGKKFKIGDGSTAWTSLAYRFDLDDLGVSDFMQTLLDDTSQAAAASTLGLGTETPWSSILQVGSTTALSVTRPAVCCHGHGHVTIIAETLNALRRYRWDGSTFTQLSTQAVADNYYGITALSFTDIAYVDRNNDDLHRYRWNGSSYSSLGHTYIGSFAACGLAALDGDTVVALKTSEIAVLTWNGSGWTENATNAYSHTGEFGYGVAAMTHRRFASLADNGSTTELAMWEWDGATTISQVGNRLTLARDAFSGICSVSSTDVLYSGSGQDDLFLYSFDGTDWTKTFEVSTGVAIATPALGMMDKDTAAILDNGMGGLEAWRLVYDRDNGPYSVVGGAF